MKNEKEVLSFISDEASRKENIQHCIQSAGDSMEAEANLMNLRDKVIFALDSLQRLTKKEDFTITH